MDTRSEMKRMNERKPIYWDRADVVRLFYSDENEAIASILDGMNQWPETLEICGFAPRVVPESFLEGTLLDDILVVLDAEFASPEDEPTGPTEAMEEAERAFIQAILEEYKPQTYEIVEVKTINVSEWVQKNRPHWVKPY